MQPRVDPLIGLAKIGVVEVHQRLKALHNCFAALGRLINRHIPDTLIARLLEKPPWRARNSVQDAPAGQRLYSVALRERSKEPMAGRLTRRDACFDL